MGRDKAFLEIRGERIIDREVRILKEVFEEVILVANEPSRYSYLDVRIAADLIPDMGPLGGLHAALMFTRSDYIFVAACDMPLLNPRLIRLMLQRASGCDVLVPEIDGYFEPLHAIYSRRCLKVIEETLNRGERQIYSFYPRVKIKRMGKEDIAEVDPHLLSFKNINTEEDYEEMSRLIDHANE
jgi:molybdopterin-guanine dinucleotide biosynthesis protein A